MSKRKQKEERQNAQLRAKLRQEKRQSTKSFLEQQEIANLVEVISAGAPAPGSSPLSLEQAPAGFYAGSRTFAELPISKYTKAALKDAGYVTMTAIQRAALPHALAGRDILGAAKTGSGKTLCFLLPLVEKLYRQSWTRMDGLGALVLTPTRELALQIFEELVKIGRRHELSAGLLIGGKDVSEEASRVNAMNILVATPGRLLQHMDETPGFEPSSLQMLVLDEADRILDMGFAATLDAILDNLPRQGRQTLLFSATQTKSVRDLARLSLDSPEYLAVHAEATTPTPLKLRQAYMVVGLGQKMDVLWGFIKTHLMAKTIIFLSTCKQVRFAYEAFRKLRPGTPLRCLHGSMKQGKRMAVYESFNASGSSGGGVLFATDIAARGLDFPNVDWVVQADCPEDVAAYIHRVGRTARYTSAGRALLLLLPSEKDAMLAQLRESKIPLQQLKHNPAKVQAIGPSLSALLSKNAELKSFAQSALIAYLRSVYLQPNKAVFNAALLPVDEYAESLGLLAAPQLKFIKHVGKKVVEEVVIGAAATDAPGGAAKSVTEGDKRQWQQILGKRKQGPVNTQQQPDNHTNNRTTDADSSDGDDALLGSYAESDELNSEQQQQDADTMDEQHQSPAHQPISSKKRKRADSTTATNTANAVSAAAAGDDSLDIFLTVKQRDVFDVQPQGLSNTQQQSDLKEAAAAVAAAAAAKPKKRKKQKIKLGVVTGQRVVFDDDGRQLDPLELLASEGLSMNSNRSQTAATDGGTGVAAASAAAGLHVVADVPEQRFALAAQLMAARDKSDKKALASLRRQARLEKKLKTKAASQGDSAPVATLIGGGSASEDEAGSYDHSGDQAGYSDYSRDATAGYGSSEDGQSDEAAVAHDVAYLGMARKPVAGQQQQQQGNRSAKHSQQHPASAQQQGQPSKEQNKPLQLQSVSLAEQEALALQLLSSKRW